MRWDYRLEHMSPEEGKRWWANKKLAVTNPKSGSSIVVRAVEYGPHESTGLDISVSPAAAEALGVDTGDEVEIAFADQKLSLGPAEQ
jgi:rare lipoprotein A (peptidoglycan hydrolase)